MAKVCHSCFIYYSSRNPSYWQKAA